MTEQRDLALLLKSRFPIVVIETHEEARAVHLLERIANQEQWPFFTWSIADGLRRTGRFDEIFFVDLPDAATRREIFSIHLAHRDLDPALYDLEAPAAAADGFSGAEIEQAVVSALYDARARRQPLATAVVVEELQRTRPLSVVMAEQVSALRAWAASRTVPAN